MRETPVVWIRRIYRNTKPVSYGRKAKPMPGADLTEPLVLEEIFTYHAPTADEIPQYNAIRAAAKEFAKILIANTPKCADQSAAIRHLREAVMTANSAIALRGLV